MTTPWGRCAALLPALLLLAHCSVAKLRVAGDRCDDSARACPSGLVCDATQHCAVGLADAGLADAGAITPDAGPGDAGPGDVGPGDAGSGDAGPGDAGPGDAGPSNPDAGADDAGQSGSDAGPSLADAGTCGALGEICCGGSTCDADGKLMCSMSNVCVPDYDWTQWGPVPSDAPSRSNYTVAAGTVTDSVTGLIWQRAVPTNPCPGYTNGCTWALAQTYCVSLNTTALGGYTSGWRLPELTELYSILNRSGEGPAIDMTAFPGAPGFFFWTATAYAPNTQAAWVIRFDDGLSTSDSVGSTGGVRCVR